MLAAGFALLAAGCGGGGSSAQPSATQPSPPQTSPHGEPITGPVPCKPHGAALTIAVAQQKFSADCLAAAADESFTIRFLNQEPPDAPLPGAVHHNMGIYTSTSAEQEIFGGSVTSPGDTVVYHVDALPRGLYYFQCDLHHFMHGTFVVT